jgi:hypothetical protein
MVQVESNQPTSMPIRQSPHRRSARSSHPTRARSDINHENPPCRAAVAGSQPGLSTSGATDASRCLWALRRTRGRHPRHGRFDRLGTQHDRRSLPCLWWVGRTHRGRPFRKGRHAFGSDQWQQERQEAFAALHSAVRALEDRIVGAHWLLTHPLPSPHLRLQLEQAQRHANILRELIEARREGPAQA